MSNRQKKRGRPCNIEPVVRIRLRKSVFLVWQEKKRRNGYSRQSYSIFAEYLLYSGVHVSILIAENDRRWMAV